jgi:hypothetical protein
LTPVQRYDALFAKDGKSAFETLLQAYSGSSIRIDRQNTERPAVYVRRPRLSICLAVQPSIVEGMLENDAMRSQGLLARFLIAQPESLVGRRPCANKPMDRRAADCYGGILHALANLPAPADDADIPTIRLSQEAQELHLRLQRAIEPRLAGDLEEIVEWANKYCGNVARIAGVLHMAEHGPNGEVSAECITNAMRIGEYLMGHAMAVFERANTSPAEKDARVLLAWAKKQPKPFGVRDVQRRGPKTFRTDKKRIVDAIEILLERGQLRSEDGSWSVAASPASPVAQP